MSPLAFCTVIRSGQRPAARTLAHSLRRHHPQARLYALLLDGPHRETRDEPWLALSSEDLVMPAKVERPSRHDVREFAAALKPAFFSTLLFNRSEERLVYLSPDTLVLGSLSGLSNRLLDRPILLVPHRLAPSPGDAHSPDEMTFIDRGAYNLDFLALRADERARRFLSWWGERLSRYCHDDPANGLYLDQRWCDMAPALFDGVGILRDERYGAAAWGRGCTGLRWERGALWRAKIRVAFFQFQGVRRAPGLHALFREYTGLLRRNRA